MKRKLLFALAAALLAASLPGAALADTVTFTLTNPTQSTIGGGTLSYSATVFAPSTNTGNEYLNGVSYTLAPTNTLTVNTGSFFNNFPLFLTPGQSYTNVLFTLMVPPSAAINLYTGGVSLAGGANSGSLGTLGAAPFTVNVVTPEPSSLLLLGSGLLSSAGLYLRRRKGA